MKTRLTILPLFIALLCCLSFTSCDSDDWDESVLTGQWWSIDKPRDVICLDFHNDHTGNCREINYWNGPTEDPFTWFVDDHLIHVVFIDGSSWIWDYDLYDGHTVRINDRLFSRTRDYYSPQYQPDSIMAVDSIQ